MTETPEVPPIAIPAGTQHWKRWHTDAVVYAECSDASRLRSVVGTASILDLSDHAQSLLR